MLLRQSNKPLACFLRKLGVCRKGDSLLLNRRIDDDLRKIRRLGCPHPGRARQAFLYQGGQLFLAHSLTPPRQRRTIKGKAMLEKRFTAEELIIGIFNPAVA